MSILNPSESLLGNFRAAKLYIVNTDGEIAVLKHQIGVDLYKMQVPFLSTTDNADRLTASAILDKFGLAFSTPDYGECEQVTDPNGTFIYIACLGRGNELTLSAESGRHIAWLTFEAFEKQILHIACANPEDVGYLKPAAFLSPTFEGVSYER